MMMTVGIRFRECGKIYSFDANDLELTRGAFVVVESEFGLGIGTVVTDPQPVEETEVEMKKILRIASDEDIEQKKLNDAFEIEAKDYCNERILARGLPMKLVCVEATLDRKRIIFYFTADGRIDFRELVKDLAAKFKTRIEMRQIGVRDKAKMVGGLGLCGKELCCRVFLSSFEPISIKMAKQQALSLNTGKLSGACGRLMCCLNFEQSVEFSGNGSESEESGLDAAVESEFIELLDREDHMDVVSSDILCCTSNGHNEEILPLSASEARDQNAPNLTEQKNSEHYKKYKKRRRRRRRFKKNE